MIQDKPRISVTPRIGEMLIQLGGTADLETDLWKIITDYVALKLAALEASNNQFEQKWNMSFDEFEQRSKDDTLGQDPYSYEVERDYWEWEAIITLLKKYRSLNQPSQPN